MEQIGIPLVKRKRPVDTCGKVRNVIVVQVGKNSAQLFFEMINREQLPIGRRRC